MSSLELATIRNRTTVGFRENPQQGVSSLYICPVAKKKLPALYKTQVPKPQTPSPLSARRTS